MENTEAKRCHGVSPGGLRGSGGGGWGIGVGGVKGGPGDLESTQLTWTHSSLALRAAEQLVKYPEIHESFSLTCRCAARARTPLCTLSPLEVAHRLLSTTAALRECCSISYWVISFIMIFPIFFFFLSFFLCFFPSQQRERHTAVEVSAHRGLLTLQLQILNIFFLFFCILIL